MDVGNFILEFLVTGMFCSSATSVICGGFFRYFLPQLLSLVEDGISRYFF
jgi:TRAP-type C4-dicarboxylate transport system permease small subunit